MSSSRTPLFVDHNQRNSFDSSASLLPDEDTSLLGGLATTSPSRPFFTTFHPTILLRSLALTLAIPSLILFLARRPQTGPITSSIVFLSFVIARQVQIVLLSHFGSQLVVIRIEVVHHRLKSVSRAAEQEQWIFKGINAFIDGVIMIGLLVSLAIVASELKQSNCWQGMGCGSLRAAVVLGFLSFGALLLSVLDFGSPSLVTMALSVERPVDGVLKWVVSVLYGEEKDDSEPAPVAKSHDAGDLV